MNYLHLFYYTGIGTALTTLATLFTANKYLAWAQKSFLSLFAFSSVLWMYVLCSAIDYNNQQIMQLFMAVFSKLGNPT